MSTLTVSIIQADLHWHDSQKNLAQFTDAIDSLENSGDLIVLPEMFTTGFTMHAEQHAETMDGVAIQWMAAMAADHAATVCGSLIIRENDCYYNRFVLVCPEGRIDFYDKRHLFRLANEQQHYTAGSDRIIVELNGWRICPMVCYDLRFPVWSRNLDDYDLLLYVANWPSRRHNAWQTLLRARAIENLSFVAGVNRTGIDGNEHPYVGGSAIIDYLGNDLADLGDTVGNATAVLDKSELAAFREKFAFHRDADSFTIDKQA